MTAVKRLADQSTYLEAGRVLRAAETIAVRLGGGSCDAQRAKSCLVEPEVGDKVLCAIEPDGVYVLAVLEGRRGGSTRVAAEGDIEVEARGGRIALCASERVDITGASAVAVSGAALHLRAKRGSVAIEELGFFGRIVQAEVAKVALMASEVDAILTRLCQRAKRVFRHIEEIDQTRAGTVDVRAQNLVAIRGENAVISARVLAKIDGEQIHLG